MLLLGSKLHILILFFKIKILPKRHSQNGVRRGYDVTDKDKVDYAEAGVDIDLEGKAVNSLVSELNSPPRLPGEIGSLIDHPGGFSGIIDFGDELLAMCTDGVGSKLMLASRLGQWETVPIDYGYEC